MEHLWSILSMFALAGLSLFMILIVLLQRGRGGGLAGAFGGAGGQSALGTRAGDVFTKITVGIAVVWILLACVNNFILKAESERYVGAPVVDRPTLTDDEPVAPGDLDLTPPAGGEADPFTPPAGGTTGGGDIGGNSVDGEVGGDAAFDPPPAADGNETDAVRPTDELDAEAGE